MIKDTTLLSKVLNLRRDKLSWSSIAHKLATTTARVKYYYYLGVGMRASRYITGPSGSIVKGMLATGYAYEEAVQARKYIAKNHKGSVLNVLPCKCSDSVMCYPHHLEKLREKASQNE